jgi:hypothetical protein
MNMNILLKALGVLAKVAAVYRAIRKAWQNVIVRLIFFGLLILLVAYYFG